MTDARAALAERARKALRLNNEIEEKSQVGVHPRPGDERIPDPAYVRRALAATLLEVTKALAEVSERPDARDARVSTNCALCGRGIHSIASRLSGNVRTVLFWAHDEQGLDNQVGGHMGAPSHDVTIGLEKRS